MFIHFRTILEFSKVNKFFIFFRQKKIFIITYQNTRSFFNNNNPHNSHSSMWIMWITWCKTFIFNCFSLFLVWKTCGQYFDSIFHILFFADNFVHFAHAYFSTFFICLYNLKFCIRKSGADCKIAYTLSPCFFDFTHISSMLLLFVS